MVSDDRVGLRRRQWAVEMPGLDTSGMAILGRARVITLSARQAIEKVFDRHGLDTGDFDVLSTLLRSGPPYRLRPTELFRWLMITSGGLTARLARLEKRGLVEAEWGVWEKNRRARYYTLTRSGRTHLKEETERVLRYGDMVRSILTSRPQNV